LCATDGLFVAPPWVDSVLYTHASSQALKHMKLVRRPRVVQGHHAAIQKSPVVATTTTCTPSPSIDRDVSDWDSSRPRPLVLRPWRSIRIFKLGLERSAARVLPSEMKIRSVTDLLSISGSITLGLSNIYKVCSSATNINRITCGRSPYSLDNCPYGTVY